VSLNGLTKGSRDKRRSASPEALKALEVGVALKTKQASKAKFVRYTFSLTDAVSKQIDALSRTPTSFRASRSDVVRAGILALSSLPKDERAAMIESAAKELK